VNCTVPPVTAEVETGAMANEVTVALVEAWVTVTVADTDFAGSALLVAVTSAVPGPEGAV
jgi:hypothetical protein